MDIEQLNYISSYTSKLLKKNFGKGPQSCQATLCSKYLIIYIRGFISPMEEVLLRQGQAKQVDKARTDIINHVLDELKGVIIATLDTDIQESYHDWNFPNNSGIIMLVLESNIQAECFDTTINTQLLEAEVGRLSHIVEKVPNEIHVHSLSSSVYVVERIGILLLIEKTLVENGFEGELKFAKDGLEKSYFHRNGNFNNIFGARVKDIFIDWDFKNDKSFIAFILE